MKHSRLVKKIKVFSKNHRLFNRCLVLLLLILIQGRFASGLEHRVEFENIRLFRGQSRINIFSIAQDSVGYMWFGTNKGLFRYDGYNFKRFIHNPDDKNGLLKNIIYRMTVDPQGVLWISANNNISKYNPVTDSFIHYTGDSLRSSSLLNSRVFSMASDSNSIWIGTSKNDLYQIRKSDGTLKNILLPSKNIDNLKKPRIYELCLDNEGFLWVGRSDNIYTLNTSTMQIEKFNPLGITSIESMYQNVRAIHINNTDDIWFGAGYNALSNFIQDTIRNYRFSDGDKELTQSSFIQDIAAEKNGDLWIGTTRDGLVYYNHETGSFTYALQNNDKIAGIENTSVNQVFVDKSGTIWVGTYKTGLFKSQQSYSFHNYETIINPDGSSKNDYIVEIRECFDGNIVLGLDKNGIAFFEPETETFKFFKNRNNDPHSLSSDNVNSILVDNDSIIWIGTSMGLNRFNSRTQNFHNYKPNPDLTQLNRSNNVRNIFGSSDSCLWISTYDGFLYLFDRQNLTYSSKYYYNSDIVHSDFTKFTKYEEAISCITEDQTGILWIGTVFSGIRTFDLKTRKFLNNYLLLSDITESIYPVKDILVDSDNNIWVGTPGQGLFKYDRFTDNFINYRDIEGLISNHITTILEDSLHNLWLGTNAGIILFDRFAQSFTPFDIDDNINFYDLSKCDGLQKSLIKGTISYKKYPISNSKGIVTKTGEIYIGGPNGFTRFDPKLISDIKPSPIIMTDFKIFDKSQCFDKQINEIKELNLTYQDYIFTFVFTLTDYNNPVKNRYAYWLEGFEKNWNYSGSDNKVTYFNIPPGKYILKAKGCNSSGIWNINPLAIRINISPPFWKTWWFRISLFLSTASIILFIVWQRISRIQRQKIELENMVKQRTKELNKSNVQLKKEVKFRKKAESEARKSEEEYHDLFENAYDVIWTSKLDGTILTINRFFRELLGYKKNNIIGTNLTDYITPEHRFRAIRNYLKFQKSQFVECELDISSKSKEIRKLWVKVSGIIDNDELVGIHGIGRDTTELKKTQEELREAEHLKREGIKQLTLKLAHEIKNPLTSITSSAQLVASSKDTRENPKIQRHMGVINKNVAICNHVIRDLYSFTHNPALRLALVKVPDFISTLIIYTKEKIEQYPNIRVESNIETSIPPIIVDEFRLLQAFKNLIDNGFEAMPEEGILSISAGYNDIDNNISIEIGDTGCGMTGEEINKIFEPLYSSKPTGFGLGMSVVKDVIDAHSGLIQIKSEKNVGTTFTIKLQASKKLS